jgi:hypothetical protein
MRMALAEGDEVGQIKGGDFECEELFLRWFSVFLSFLPPPQLPALI